MGKLGDAGAYQGSGTAKKVRLCRSRCGRAWQRAHTRASIYSEESVVNGLLTALRGRSLAEFHAWASIARKRACKLTALVAESAWFQGSEPPATRPGNTG